MRTNRHANGTDINGDGRGGDRHRRVSDARHARYAAIAGIGAAVASFRRSFVPGGTFAHGLGVSCGTASVN
jgi:hypothetical protein